MVIFHISYHPHFYHLILDHAHNFLRSIGFINQVKFHFSVTIIPSNSIDGTSAQLILDYSTLNFYCCSTYGILYSERVSVGIFCIEETPHGLIPCYFLWYVILFVWMFETFFLHQFIRHKYVYPSVLRRCYQVCSFACIVVNFQLHTRWCLDDQEIVKSM